ncbi:MAG TPA: FkbM family methyltransferase [Pyrinomonadaceae bacterium]|nr:FkbM family methyltransferase [Pyrinomonadaceae bacterium]
MENENSTQPSQGNVTGLLKKILFRESIKHPRLQRLWSRLHTLAIFGMNYGGGGLIETSGETWVLSEVVANACKHLSGPVIFDVGANVGDYSLLTRGLLPAATIHAFEPAKAVFDQLVANIAKAGAENQIKPHNFGFSDSERTVEFYSYTVEGQEASVLGSIDQRLPTQVLDVQTQASEEIQVRTIDRFCEAEGIDRIDFLKLDVEGHELSVLRGAQRMLANGAVSMIQFEFGPANIYSRTYFYDFWSLISGAYDIYRIVPQGLALLNYYGEHHEIFLTTNYLALKKQTS